MNLPRFLREIDDVSDGMQRETLIAFVHETARTLPESKREDFLKKLRNMQNGCNTGQMEENHRAYYGECARYIAALGEVKESRGTINGKQKIMLEYKELYSRRTAFHKELRAYGMKDSRKGKR